MLNLIWLIIEAFTSKFPTAFIILVQVKKQCTEQEQVIGALQNDIASSNRKQIQLNKSAEQLQEQLLVSKNEFSETSNKNNALEITITELKNEKELMQEELCQVRFFVYTYFLCGFYLPLSFECECHN